MTEVNNERTCYSNTFFYLDLNVSHDVGEKIQTSGEGVKLRNLRISLNSPYNCSANRSDVHGLVLFQFTVCVRTVWIHRVTCLLKSYPYQCCFL